MGDMADEFLSQMSYNELDNQMNRGEMYANELSQLNTMADEDLHDDMGESDSSLTHSSLSASLAPCKGDQECRHAIRAIILGEEKDGGGEKASCKDQNPDICHHKKILCEHPTHANKILAECPSTCGLCASMAKKTTCADKTDACIVKGRNKYCKLSREVTSICPVMCGSCEPAPKLPEEYAGLSLPDQE